MKTIDDDDIIIWGARSILCSQRHDPNMRSILSLVTGKILLLRYTTDGKWASRKEKKVLNSMEEKQNHEELKLY